MSDTVPLPEQIHFRAIAPSDAVAIAALSAQCPRAAQWPAGSYASSLAAGACGWLVEAAAAAINAQDVAQPSAPNETPGEAQRVVLGFVLVRAAADELEILDLAVALAVRRRGIARRLLEAVRKSHPGLPRIHLEVRASNVDAIAFYRSEGFVKAGRRKAYYRDPVEDAILLSRA